MPMTDSDATASAGAGGGSVVGMHTATGARPTGATRTRRAGAADATRSTSVPLHTRKLRCVPRRTNDTSSFPVIRHHAGKSSSTEISVERNSRSCPRAIGSRCWRINSRRPLPQSRSPPSKLTSAANGCRSTGCTMTLLVADAGAPVGQELDELGAADHRRPRDEAVFVERALLEARRAHVHGSARLGEVVHQLLEWREALLVNAVRESFLRRSEEHTSELQSLAYLVCRLLLEKKKKI